MVTHNDLEVGMKVKMIDEISCSCPVCHKASSQVLTIKEIIDTVGFVPREITGNLFIHDIEEIVGYKVNLPDELFKI